MVSAEEKKNCLKFIPSFGQHKLPVGKSSATASSDLWWLQRCCQWQLHGPFPTLQSWIKMRKI